MKYLFTILFSALLIIPVSARIIRVPQDYPKIQKAVNEALPGDTVLVAPGVYYENIDFGGKFQSSYCDIQGGLQGTGNINVNPAFKDTTSFMLSDTSACIDTRDTSLIFNDITDSLHLGYAKYPSKGIIRNDIGGYGGPLAFNISGFPVRQKVYLPAKRIGYSLGHNYPNPFNPSTMVTFSVPVKAHVSVKIYDISGKEIKKIYSGELLPGIYVREWNAGKNSAGIYFCRMQA